jgi:hypothetical protein
MPPPATLRAALPSAAAVLLLALLLVPAAYSFRSLPDHGTHRHQQRHLLQTNSTTKLSTNPSNPPSATDEFVLTAVKLAYMSTPSYVRLQQPAGTCIFNCLLIWS